MAQVQGTAILCGWEGYRIRSTKRIEAQEPEGTAIAIVELEPEAKYVPICSGCGRAVARVHERVSRCVRDLPILDAITYVCFDRRRVLCGSCGIRVERVQWLDSYSRVTKRLAESVARMCRVLPIKHVASYYKLGWDAVKAIDKAWLGKELGPVDLSGVEVIAMDQFAIRRHHQYATVVVDARSKRVLWVGRGRGREDVRPFFALLGPGRLCEAEGGRY